MKNSLLKMFYLFLLTSIVFVFINFFYAIQTIEEIAIAMTLIFISIYFLNKFGILEYFCKKLYFVFGKTKSFYKNKTKSNEKIENVIVKKTIKKKLLVSSKSKPALKISKKTNSSKKKSIKVTTKNKVSKNIKNKSKVKKTK